MKKITFVIWFALVLQGINAQETDISNKIILGGSLNFLIQNNTYPLNGLSINSGIGGIFSNSTNDTKNTTFAFSPYIGKEMNSRFFFGFQLDYRIGRYHVDDLLLFGQQDLIDFERNSTQIGFGIFTRHMLNPDSRFSFFIQPHLGYHLLNEEERQSSVTSQEEKANFFEVRADLGLLYNINNTIRVTMRTGGINYINGNWEIKDTDTRKSFSSFGTNLNLSSIFFGIEIRI